jgi:hypothetical protein
MIEHWFRPNENFALCLDSGQMKNFNSELLNNLNTYAQILF